MARSPCLNITLRNLLRIYPTDAAVGDAPYQAVSKSSVTDIQSCTAWECDHPLSRTLTNPSMVKITVSPIPTKRFQSKRRPRDHAAASPTRRQSPPPTGPHSTRTPATNNRTQPHSSQRSVVRSDTQPATTPYVARQTPTAARTLPQQAAKRASSATPLQNPYAKHAKRAPAAVNPSQSDNDRLMLSQSLELDDGRSGFAFEQGCERGVVRRIHQHSRGCCRRAGRLTGRS